LSKPKIPLGVFLSPSIFFLLTPFFPIQHLNSKLSTLRECLFFKIIVILYLYMNNQTLFIYELPTLFDIFIEIEENLNFEVKNIKKKEISKIDFNEHKSYLILSLKDIDLPNLILFNNFPLKFSKLLEKINIEFLKKNFHEKSNIAINKYIINTNSREMILQKQRLKLTEKEIDMIIYLAKIKKPIKVDELQEKVWGYQSKLETHTVETHIHRLRKKIKEKFFDENLIVSKKNGYQISEKK